MDPLFSLGPELLILAWMVVAILAAFGMPLFAVIALAAMICWQSAGGNFLVIFIKQASIANVPLYIAIPLFTFAGTILSESNTPTRVVNLARACFGWLPGSLSIVAIVACAFFTAFTGASGVTIIALGGLLYPILLKEKYPERFSLGLLTTGGSLGLLWPPSLPLILYALYANRPEAPISVEGLFRAGILPGTLLVLVLAGYCFWVGKKSKAPTESFSLKKLLKALGAAAGELPIPIIVFGGIYGWFEIESMGLRLKLTAAEASAVVALYVLFAQFVIYRDIKITKLPGIIRKSMELVGAIFVIIGAAMGLTSYLVQENVPTRILGLMRGPIANQPGLVRACLELTDGDPQTIPGYGLATTFPEKMPAEWQASGDRPAVPGPAASILDAILAGESQVEKLGVLARAAEALRNEVRWARLAALNESGITTRKPWVERLSFALHLKQNPHSRLDPPPRPAADPTFDAPFDDDVARMKVPELVSFTLGRLAAIEGRASRFLEGGSPGGESDLKREYLNPEEGYRLWLPEGWREEVEKKESVISAHFLDGEGHLSLSVYVEQLAVGGPYRKAADFQRRARDLWLLRHRAAHPDTEPVPDAVATAWKDQSPIQEEDITLNGLSGRRLSFAPSGESTGFSVAQTFLLGRRQLFVLTLGMAKDARPEILGSIASSFEGLEPVARLLDENGVREGLIVLRKLLAWIEKSDRPKTTDLEAFLNGFEPLCDVYSRLGKLDTLADGVEKFQDVGSDEEVARETSYGDLETSIEALRKVAGVIPRLKKLEDETAALEDVASRVDDAGLKERLRHLARLVDAARKADTPIVIDDATLDDFFDKLDEVERVIFWARISFLLVLNLFLLVVGCMMDIFSAILVVVPLIVPLAIKFGVNPYHLGIIFLTNLEIGYSTPPVGINLFIAGLRFEKPVVELYWASVPFLLLLGLCLAIITYFPWLTMLLVR